MGDWIGLDEFDAKVVSACDEGSARRLAALKVGDEGKECWLDESRSMVTEIGLARDPEHEQVILESFHAG
jgi:hypothetical protein